MSSVHLGSWNLELGWVDEVPISKRKKKKSKKDASVVVASIVSQLRLMTPHDVTAANEQNITCAGRRSTMLSVWLFDDAQKKTNNVSTVQSNAWCSLSVDLRGSHTEFWTRGCPSWFNFLTWNSNFQFQLVGRKHWWSDFRGKMGRTLIYEGGMKKNKTR